jgi:hypothetical protein
VRKAYLILEDPVHGGDRIALLILAGGGLAVFGYEDSSFGRALAVFIILSMAVLGGVLLHKSRKARRIVASERPGVIEGKVREKLQKLRDGRATLRVLLAVMVGMQLLMVGQLVLYGKPVEWKDLRIILNGVLIALVIAWTVFVLPRRAARAAGMESEWNPPPRDSSSPG